MAFANSVLGTPGSGFADINGNPVDPANTRFLVDPANRVNIAGRNTLRADRVNSFDASVNTNLQAALKGHRLELRVEFFNVFNHPNFTLAGVSSDLSNGDVTNPFFNNAPQQRREPYWALPGTLRILKNEKRRLE